jgi:hypothetical protein
LKSNRLGPLTLGQYNSVALAASREEQFTRVNQGVQRIIENFLRGLSEERGVDLNKRHKSPIGF